MTARSRRILLVLAIVIAGIAVDQVVKRIAFSGLGDRAVPIGGVAQLRAIENRGAMLGLGASWSAGPRLLLFAIVESALLALLAAWAIRGQGVQPAEAAAVALVVAGAASNVIDRLAHGLVRDYVLIGRPGWPTAAFNLADVFVFAGAIVAVVAALRFRKSAARAAAALLAFALVGGEVRASEPVRPFPVRIVKLGGLPGERTVDEHLAFCRSIGFNAVFVYSHQAGRWTASARPDPKFVTMARALRAQGVDIWVSINPVADTGERFVFDDRGGERRLVAFMRKLHAKAGVDKFILSFDDQPTALTEFRDIVRYGVSAAPAHLDLTARVARRLPRGTALWLLAAAYCDAHLGDGRGPYASSYLAGLPKLPREVGVVWTGPQVISASIRRSDLEATRARLGGRPLFLYDNFPVNDDEPGDALALILGALREREPGIRDVAAAYLSCPMTQLGASRLPLTTIAEFLRDPEGYDADRALARAVDRLSGGVREVRTALDTQVLEWGGWIGTRNYWHRDLLNAASAGDRLDDPAFVDSFTWTADRYPGRMEALSRLTDGAFRDDLLLVMRRRLAVARAMPPAVEYLARLRAGRPDAAELLHLLEAQRRDLAPHPDAARILDLFLDAAGIPIR